MKSVVIILGLCVVPHAFAAAYLRVNQAGYLAGDKFLRPVSLQRIDTRIGGYALIRGNDRRVNLRTELEDFVCHLRWHGEVPEKPLFDADNPRKFA